MTAILKVDTIQDTAGNNIINESSNTITIGASGDTTNIVGTLQNNGAAVGGDNTPAFMVKLSAQQNIPNTTWTKITFDSEVYDTDNKFASNKFTPTVAGKYNFMLQVCIDDLGDQKMMQLQIYKNGSAQVTSLTRLYGPITEKQTSWCNWSDTSDDNDYYEAYIYHDIGSTKPLRVDLSTIWMGYKLIT